MFMSHLADHAVPSRAAAKFRHDWPSGSSHLVSLPANAGLGAS